MSPHLLGATPTEPLSVVFPNETITNNPVFLFKHYKEEISKHLYDFLSHTTAAYQSATEIARLLHLAHRDLSSEDYALLVDTLKISSHYKMMRLAYNPRLATLAENNDLPDKWTVQYEIIQMDDKTFEQAARLGCKTLTVKAAQKLRKDADGAKNQKKSGSASSAWGKASTHTPPKEPGPETPTKPASPRPTDPTHKAIESEPPHDEDNEEWLGEGRDFLYLSLPATEADTILNAEIHGRLVVMFNQLAVEFPALDGISWAIKGDR